jgi:hypothetical protein
MKGSWRTLVSSWSCQNYVINCSIGKLSLRHYVTSRKVAGSRRDEVNEFLFPIYLILPTALVPGVHSASNKYEFHKMLVESRARPAFKGNTITAIYGRLSRQCWILNISQPYRLPRPVTGIALLYGDGVCFL